MTILLKYTIYATTPPSRYTTHDEHCCDCSNCWGNQREEGAQDCPYGIPQFCMICNEKSVFGLSLEKDHSTDIMNHSHTGSVAFWVCDKHLEDEKLLNVLRKGVPRYIAKNRRKLISFVRKEMEKDLI